MVDMIIKSILFGLVCSYAWKILNSNHQKHELKS